MLTVEKKPPCNASTACLVLYRKDNIDLWKKWLKKGVISQWVSSSMAVADVKSGSSVSSAEESSGHYE